MTWAEVIRKAHGNLVSLSPPSEFASFHTGLIDGTENCDVAMDHLIKGIENKEPDELEMVSGPLESCSKALELAKELD